MAKENDKDEKSDLIFYKALILRQDFIFAFFALWICVCCSPLS